MYRIISQHYFIYGIEKIICVSFRVSYYMQGSQRVKYYLNLLFLDKFEYLWVWKPKNYSFLMFISFILATTQVNPIQPSVVLLSVRKNHHTTTTRVIKHLRFEAKRLWELKEEGHGRRNNWKQQLGGQHRAEEDNLFFNQDILVSLILLWTGSALDYWGNSGQPF